MILFDSLGEIIEWGGDEVDDDDHHGDYWVDDDGGDGKMMIPTSRVALACE